MTRRAWRAMAVGAVLVAGGVAVATAPQGEPGVTAPAVTAPARVDGRQARALVAQGARLLDVRTPAEFGAGHIEGAINVPLDELESRIGELGDRRAPVIVYCHSGRRSALAARKLQDAGFERVYDLGPKGAW